MHVLVTLLIILLSFLYDNLSEFTNTEWLFNYNVWFLLCLLIKLPFHTLSCEHQIIHIFMSYLEACLHFTLELLQKIWSTSDKKIINMQATHTNGLPSFRVTTMHRIHKMFQQFFNNFRCELWCGCKVWTFSRKKNRHKNFSFLFKWYKVLFLPNICIHLQQPPNTFPLHNRGPKEVLLRSIIWIRCSKCLCSIAYLGMTILIWYPTCLVFNWLQELQKFFINNRGPCTIFTFLLCVSLLLI